MPIGANIVDVAGETEPQGGGVGKHLFSFAIFFPNHLSTDEGAAAAQRQIPADDAAAHVSLDLDQESLGDLIARFCAPGVPGLVRALYLAQRLYRMGLGVLIHDLVVGWTEQEQVVEPVARLVGLA